MNFEGLEVPGSVIETTQYVVEHARDVRIDTANLETIAEKVEQRLAQGIDSVEVAFGSSGTLERDVNLVLFETACNFYFWDELPEARWTVESGGQQVGGWYGLAACFNKAAQNGTPVYDANWVSQITTEQAQELFAGTNEIPLLEKRVENLKETADFLLQKHGGQALHFLAANDFSAPRIAEQTVRELPSFRDGAWYRDKWIWLLKRAQILPSDLYQLTSEYPDFAISDCDQLTAFADYRLPQILRHYGVMQYSDELAKSVDTGATIPVGSSEEVEIRAATIVACEQIKQHLPERTSADIDLGLWLISQDMRTDPTLQPHHRTPGYFY